MISGGSPQDTLIGPGLVTVLALAMLLVPAQALATHNSVGTNLEIVRATEVDETTGQLSPDVVEDTRMWNFSQTYHSGALGDEVVPNRTGPTDQMGQAYNPDGPQGCTAFHESPIDKDVTVYKHHLPNWAEQEESTVEPFYVGEDEGDVFDPDAQAYINPEAIDNAPSDACWIGLLDDKTEYIYGGALIGLSTAGITESETGIRVENPYPTGQETNDPLYFLNPSEDDDAYHEQCGDLDQRATDEDCREWSHSAYWSGFSNMVAIDVNLVEAALGGAHDDATPTDVAELGGTSKGSGTSTIPQIITYKTFLMGFPHPANEDPSEITSEDMDLSGLVGVPQRACGAIADTTPGVTEDTARTPPGDDCRLLSPTDLKHYDQNWNNGAIEEENRGRLCAYTPQYVTVNPDGVAGGPCGVLGTEITQFYTVREAGGFSTGTLPTYLATLPGYKQGVVGTFSTTSVAWVDYAFKFGTENTTGHNDQFYGPSSWETLIRIVAVNPEVPTGQDDAWCVRPQIMTDGETVNDADEWDANEVANNNDSLTLSEAEAIGELPAPGVYGTYQADGIDNDAYSNPFNGYVQTLHNGDDAPGYDGFHETFDVVLDEVDSGVGTLFTTANSIAGSEDPEDAPLPEPLPGLLDTVEDANERAGPAQSQDPEPKTKPGGDAFESFDREIQEGVVCDAQSQLVFNEDPETVPGALNYRVSLDRDLVALKDPTVFNESEEDLQPARENETSESAWHTESYSVSGPFVAYLDTTNTTDFQGCAADDGQPDPGSDVCVWEALWDAYSGTCDSEVEGESATCGEILAERGFNVGSDQEEDEVNETFTDPYGVGLFGTLELTGPTLVSGPSDDRIVNDDDPSATTCVIFTSPGFQDPLASHIVSGGVDAEWDSTVEQQICSGYDADRIEVFQDGFGGQDGPEDTGFDASVSWVPLVSSPNATQAEDRVDRACVTGVFSVQSDIVGTDGIAGTQENIQLGSDHAETYYTDCMEFSSQHHEDPADRTAVTDRDGVHHDAPEDRHGQ